MQQPGLLYSKEHIRPSSVGIGDHNAYSVRILQNPEEVRSVRESWERWQIHPNTDLDHFLLVCGVRTNVYRPHVIVVSEGGNPRAILVARLERVTLAPAIGYFTPIRISVNQLSVLYCGLLGDTNDEQIAEIILQSLQNSLNSGEADIVELYHLHEGSLLLNTALRRVSRFQRDSKPQSSIHWEVNLERQPGGILLNLSAKHRYWIRRKARELENAFPGRISYRTFLQGGDVEKLCSDLEAVGRLTYQRSLGAGFVDDAEHRERFALFSSRNQLRAWTLCIDDIPRVFCLGTVYNNTFYFAETGYDPVLRPFEIGTLAFLHMADELTKEGVAKIDFGFGQAFYKQRFGDHSWRDETLRLYARTLKGFAAIICVRCCAGATVIAQWALRRIGLVDKLKKAWRHRLASQPKTDKP